MTLKLLVHWDALIAIPTTIQMQLEVQKKPAYFSGMQE